MVAILIFSFGILALIGLQANATQAATKSQFRINAGLLVSQCIADLWLDRANLTSTNCACTAEEDLLEGDSPPLPNGEIDAQCSAYGDETPPSTQVTVTVTWKAPGDSEESTHQAIALITTNP
jgi:type IV pilus assembly protein PilV